MKGLFDFSLKAVFFVLSAAFVIVVMSLGLLLGTEILITVIDTAKSVPEYIANTINIGEETNKQKPPQPQRMDFEIYLKKIAFACHYDYLFKNKRDEIRHNPPPMSA